MLTQSRLKELVTYDPATGVFTRIVSAGSKAPAGSVMGSPAGLGKHLRATVDGKRYYLHCLAWLYEYGVYPAMIDHIDTDTQNNKIANLRLATKSDNGCNRNAPCTNTSGVKGVSWDNQTSSWMVQVRKGSISHKKRFRSFDAAVQHRIQMGEALHLMFAREAAYV